MMNNFILSELARAWRARTEHDNIVFDGSEAGRIFEAEQKGIDRAYLECSGELEAVVKMLGGLD
jgi:hypothetical protein